MLARKAADFSLELMIFATPSALVSQINMPSITVMHNMQAAEHSARPKQGEEHDQLWYEDLYRIVLENSDAVLVDPFENTDYITDVAASNPADITLLSFDLDADELAENLTQIIAPIAKPEF
jgi:hypothetical protein